MYAADVDGDGDVDVLSASLSPSLRDGQIAWYENTDGQGTFGEQQVIATEDASSVQAADMDGDGDVDVLSGSLGTIAWYENTDGQGTFGDQQVITPDLLWCPFGVCGGRGWRRGHGCALDVS